jgi:hypothetical protein
MMKQITILLTTAAIIFSLSISAQNEPGKPNQLDERFTPPSNSILGNQSSSGSSSFSSGSTMDIKNNFKFNPILFSRNITAIFYERFILEELSFTGGLGYCYGKDRMVEIGTLIDLDIMENSTSRLSLENMMSNGKFIKGGNYFTSLGVRIYWDTYDNNRFGYLELNTRYYKNKLSLSNIYELQSTTNVEVINTTYNMIYGTQFHTDGKIKTVHDFYCGFGIRGSSYNIFEYKTFFDAHGSEINRLVKTQEKEKVFSPIFLIGYAFGFGF